MAGKQSATGRECPLNRSSLKEIDRAAMGRNYEDMIMSNKAILKGGRKIIWA